MRFTFQSRPTEDASAGQPAAFRVGRLWRHEGRRATEVSHLIDRTYDYASVRELRWHLAERFNRPVPGVALEPIG
jgi:spore coat polysaccharide biosynthesis protein SpsF (cytidylyltransferase family)